MRGSNLQAVGLWQSLLWRAKKSPFVAAVTITATPCSCFPVVPPTCIYALSGSGSDILAALRLGRAYITYSANGPGLEMTAGDAMLGDSVDFSRVRQFEFIVSGLLAGDVVQVVTAHGSTPLLKAETDGSMRGNYAMDAPGFARLEVLRSFLPGLPLLPASIANPIYFDA